MYIKLDLGLRLLSSVAEILKPPTCQRIQSGQNATFSCDGKGYHVDWKILKIYLTWIQCISGDDDVGFWPDMSNTDGLHHLRMIVWGTSDNNNTAVVCRAFRE